MKSFAFLHHPNVNVRARHRAMNEPHSLRNPKSSIARHRVQWNYFIPSCTNSPVAVRLSISIARESILRVQLIPVQSGSDVIASFIPLVKLDSSTRKFSFLVFASAALDPTLPAIKLNPRQWQKCTSIGCRGWECLLNASLCEFWFRTQQPKLFPFQASNVLCVMLLPAVNSRDSRSPSQALRLMIYLVPSHRSWNSFPIRLSRRTDGGGGEAFLSPTQSGSWSTKQRIKIHHCGEPKPAAWVAVGSFSETSEWKSFSLFSDVTVSFHLAMKDSFSAASILQAEDFHLLDCDMCCWIGVSRDDFEKVFWFFALKIIKKTRTSSSKIQTSITGEGGPRHTQQYQFIIF